MENNYFSNETMSIMNEKNYRIADSVGKIAENSFVAVCALNDMATKRHIPETEVDEDTPYAVDEKGVSGTKIEYENEDGEKYSIFIILTGEKLNPIIAPHDLIQFQKILSIILTAVEDGSLEEYSFFIPTSEGEADISVLIVNEKRMEQKLANKPIFKVAGKKLTPEEEAKKICLGLLSRRVSDAFAVFATDRLCKNMKTETNELSSTYEVGFAFNDVDWEITVITKGKVEDVNSACVEVYGCIYQALCENMGGVFDISEHGIEVIIRDFPMDDIEE